ncbi:MAG: biosynthetic-type acetolactate synthase large subunit [Clostridia bacterium]|jgi:acetolactate synthase-1/2/3 large subunit|nr:biosynthetic-type acetolactate synthase large subunit [Clostridia bacterium]MCI9291423.1 biosynthetic-type acetolactate synthase large subunit [Clostridia bacterium]
MITGAQLFVKALNEENVDTLFAYPGGQIIDLLDELYNDNSINMILPRHEQGLAHAADGYARSSGKPGVCLVTSGPGATNLVTAIATANYDAVPLVCFTGQVVTSLIGKDAFQEADIVGMVKSVTKFAITVRNREELGAIIRKAFVIAQSGKPGSVLVDIPKDIQQQLGSEEYPIDIQRRDTLPTLEQQNKQINKAIESLQSAKRPLLLAGGGVKISKAERELSKFVELTGIPVVTTIMGKGAIPSDSPLFYGNVGIHGSFGANTAVDKCDLLLSVGVRFNDRIAGSKENFAKHAKIIHIDIDPSTVSRNILADIPILGDAKKVLSLLTENVKPLKLSAWIKDLDELKSAYPVKIANDKLNPQMIIEKLNTLFDDIIVATDVGQNQLWTTQFLKLNESRRLLTSGGFGTMGFGLPAAIGAKLANPKTPVVAIVGDGGFQMNVQELATAVINDLPIIICLLNNCWLGNVRQWQELYYGKRYQSTCLRRRATCPTRCVTTQECPAYVPNFQKLADSYEVKYRRVTSKEEIDEAFAFAMQQTEYPTLLEFMIDEEENVYPIILPGKDLSTVKFSKE